MLFSRDSSATGESRCLWYSSLSRWFIPRAQRRARAVPLSSTSYWGRTKSSGRHFRRSGPAFSRRFYRAIVASQARPLCFASRCPMERKFLRMRNHAGRDPASRRLSETESSRQSPGSFIRDDRRYARHTSWSQASATIWLEALNCEWIA